MRWPAETLNASRHLRAALSTRWTVALLNVGGAWHTWAYPLTGPSTGQGSRLELGDGERFEALALANDHLLAGSSETLLCFDLAQRSVAWRRPYSNARSAVACVIENADEPVFLLAGRGGQLVRVGRSPGLTPLGATSEPAAFVAHDPASQRVALVTGTGQVLAGEPNALERWGKLSQAQALTWHHGRLVGLDETGLTVWESGVARETLELHTVNQLGTSLGSTTGGHLLVGTAFGSIHVFEPR